MDLFVNDLSMDGQFPDIPSFRDAIIRVMVMRKIASQFGRELHCHRNVASAKATHDLTIRQAAQHFSRNEQQALLSWLNRLGPFWDDMREHSPDDYLLWGDTVVTDTALGEAAYCGIHGGDRRVVSITPSAWEFSPIRIVWNRGDGSNLETDVINYFACADMEAALRSVPPPITSWERLASIAKLRFTHLTFANDSFESLRGHPFHHGAAYRIIELLHTLEKLRTCVDEYGHRTADGNRIYQDQFTGTKAWFTDSSDSEKNDFRKELTFPHLDDERQSIFCTWHGKVKSPQIRIHFTWPVPNDQPLYVVYIGPKITKR